MGLDSPLALFGLSLIAVLIAFYFLKKQFEDQPISTLFLWKEVTQSLSSEKWWRRLQNQPLLWFQLFAMLLMILALTHPFFTTHRFLSSSKAVILLDSSASMAAKTGGDSTETKFNEAKSKAIDLVRHLPNGAELTVIDAKAAPQIVLSKSTNKAEVIRKIRQLPLSYQHEDMPEAIRLAESVGRHFDMFLFSDHLTPKQIPNKITRTSSISVTNVGKTAENMAIETFGVRTIGEGVSGIITLHNYASKAVNGTVQVADPDGKVLKRLKVKVPANKALTVQVRDLPNESVYIAKWVNKDDAQYDNQAAAFLEDKEDPILYLAGDSGPFIPKALDVLGYHTVTVTPDPSGQYHFNQTAGPGAFVLSGVAYSDWPKGPKLILSPKQGGPFNIGNKVELKEGLKGGNDSLLQYVDVSRIFMKKAFQSDSSLNTVLSSGQNPIVQKGSYKGDPLILMLFDLADSDWPLHPSFPIFIKNAMEELLKGSGQLGISRPGNALAVQWLTSTTSAIIEDTHAKKVMDVPLNRNQMEVPPTPGLYYLQETTRTGVYSRPFAVQTSNTESDVSHKKSFQIKGESGSVIQLGKIDLSHWLILLALISLFAEWEVYRRHVAH
ncbi:MAG: vWA domain-containing protein [Tuberibacillus sp.]